MKPKITKSLNSVDKTYDMFADSVLVGRAVRDNRGTFSLTPTPNFTKYYSPYLFSGVTMAVLMGKLADHVPMDYVKENEDRAQAEARAAKMGIPMTPTGYAALEEKLKQLRTVERPAIVKAISEARDHGDLKENAEYHSAREEQSRIEGRIMKLEGVLSRADVIDPAKLSGPVKFGAKVTVVDEDTGEEKTWQIVGEHEANIEAGLLNIESPIARALIGNDEGDSVEVTTPGGEKAYEILKIVYS